MCLWGAEGAERLSATNDSTSSVHVYDLTTGALVYKMSTKPHQDVIKWHAMPTLGLLVCAYVGVNGSELRPLSFPPVNPSF